MVTRYRLTAPIPAMRQPPAGAEIADRRVMLPAEAVLFESVQRNGTLKRRRDRVRAGGGLGRSGGQAPGQPL